MINPPTTIATSPSDGRRRAPRGRRSVISASIAATPRAAQLLDGACRRAALAALGSVLACSPPREPTARAPRVASPGGVLTDVAWTAEQLAAPTVVKLAFATAEQSHHQVRTRVSERPHVHEKSDLFAIALSGNTQIHVADRTFILAPGDAVSIPRGTPHWLELLDDGPAQAYTIFSPPFQKGDRRFLD